MHFLWHLPGEGSCGFKPSAFAFRTKLQEIFRVGFDSYSARVEVPMPVLPGHPEHSVQVVQGSPSLLTDTILNNKTSRERLWAWCAEPMTLPKHRI